MGQTGRARPPAQREETGTQDAAATHVSPRLRRLAIGAALALSAAIGALAAHGIPGWA